MDDDNGAATATFGDVYEQPDPRPYVRAVADLDYQTPEHARGVFSLLARSVVGGRDGRPRGVLDLCCSYGITAALLNHELTLADLYRRYRSTDLDAAPHDRRVAADRAYYAAHRRPEAVPTVGLDVAAPAVAYALATGLLDAGVCADLERHDPSAALADLLADVGLVTVTGGLSFITGVTFDRVLGAAAGDDPPWIAMFTLRSVDVGPIGAVADRHGLVLEQVPGRTFRQRRFAHADERRVALERVRRVGLDPDGIETDGYHHTVLHVARPRREAATALDAVLAPALPPREQRR